MSGPLQWFWSFIFLEYLTIYVEYGEMEVIRYIKIGLEKHKARVVQQKFNNP